MSLDRIGPCLACGTECEGWVCSNLCELELVRQREENLRERELREARAELERRRVARKAQFASWGPK